MGIKENLKKIKEQIGNHNVKIIAVTKYATQEQIAEAYKLDICDFAESYIQDAIPKLNKFTQEENPEKKIRWHFIGRLQNNKVRFAIENFHLIHSVSSVELANLISKTASNRGITQSVLLQVNTSQEASKAGLSSFELNSSFEDIIKLPNIDVKGLMTIAPKTIDTNIIKDCFNNLYVLREELNKKYMVNLKELSMGMTNDYKEAIDCGATIIRIGKGIFNE